MNRRHHRAGALITLQAGAHRPGHRIGSRGSSRTAQHIGKNASQLICFLQKRVMSKHGRDLVQPALLQSRHHGADVRAAAPADPREYLPLWSVRKCARHPRDAGRWTRTGTGMIRGSAGRRSRGRAQPGTAPPGNTNRPSMSCAGPSKRAANSSAERYVVIASARASSMPSAGSTRLDSEPDHAPLRAAPGAGHRMGAIRRADDQQLRDPVRIALRESEADHAAIGPTGNGTQGIDTQAHPAAAPAPAPDHRWKYWGNRSRRRPVRWTRHCPPGSRNSGSASDHCPAACRARQCQPTSPRADPLSGIRGGGPRCHPGHRPPAPLPDPSCARRCADRQARRDDAADGCRPAPGHPRESAARPAASAHAGTSPARGTRACR